MNKFATLVRREVQEYRSLWMAPLFIAAIMLVVSVIGAMGLLPGRSSFGSPSGNFVPSANFVDSTQISTAMFLGMFAAIVLTNYLLDCLYAERRDRSILFWKSLPVSDAQTVLSKLFVATVLAPLFVVVLAVVLQPVFMLVGMARFDDFPIMDWIRPATWAAAVGRLLLGWLYAALWYLPVMGYLMLVSVIARRTPLLYAALPVGIGFLWDIVMGYLPTRPTTSYPGDPAFHRFLFDRLGGGEGAQPNLLRPDGNHWLPFHDPALWVGVAVGAGMLYTVIRLRRYRDDT